MKKKAFTLIELITVLVILAILALIATPLVMNIIRKARIAADKRSIDAYGRSIELAIATYLLDNGDFPTSINDLTIEYSGDEVVCSTTQLNGDSSIYLAGCTVGGRSVEGYTYGKEETVTYDAYSVGDEVTYNGVDYYVIKDSNEKEASLTLLKAEPLTVEEVNTYGGVGTANNHVNMYSTNNTSLSYYQTAHNQNGYGGMAYYSSSTCGYNGTDGCTTDYASSEIKYVVDGWKNAKAPAASEARLITKDELIDNLGYVINENATTEDYISSEETPNFVYNSNYWYWTMSPWSDTSYYVWSISASGRCKNFNDAGGDIMQPYGLVRPVITLSKSLIS